MTTPPVSPSLTAQFAQALLTLDEPALAQVSADNLSWSIPGKGLVSGVHVGVEAVIGVATTIKKYGVSIEVEQILEGRDGITAILHERGTYMGRSLDVLVALTLGIKNGQVATLTGFISDVAAYDDYLSPGLA